MKETISILINAVAWLHHEACERDTYKKEKLYEGLYNCLLEAEKHLQALEKID